MNENSRKMCRFCLHEEKYEDENKVLSVFQNETDLTGVIKTCTKIKVSPDDRIPPNICTKCVECLVKFHKFLDCCRKSEKVLREIYMPNSTESNVKPELSNEYATESTGGQFSNEGCKIEDMASDDFDDTDSDISSVKESTVERGAKKGKAKPVKLDGSAQENVDCNIYVCSICSEEFKSFFEYQDHQEMHNGQFVFSCTKCDQVFSERQKLVEHDANHKVACQVCSKMVLPKSLTAHLRKHTDMYRCPKCNLSHTSKASLENHIKARHMGVKGLVCHVCGKQSSCQSSLTRHLACHDSNRPYQCKLCTFSTKSQSILKVHMTRKHLGVQKSCQVCGKLFKSEISLKQHTKRIHIPRKHVCHICQKAFAEKHSLEKHLVRKHSKQQIYDCKTCSKEFPTVRKLKEHMHSHRQGCVSCPKCGKQFFYKKYLEKHVAKCVPGDKVKNKLSRLKSTISLPSSSMQLENFKDYE